MELPEIVGICGRKGSGKTTLAKGLQAARGYRSEVVSFAVPIKMIAIDLWGQTAGQVFGSNADKNAPSNCPGLTVRQLLQAVGTKMRELDPGVWIDCAMRAASAFGCAIVDDVRFPNEVAAIRARGGLVVKLARGIRDGDTHESEAGVDAIRGDIEVPEGLSAEETLYLVERELNERGAV